MTGVQRNSTQMFVLASVLAGFMIGCPEVSLDQGNNNQDANSNLPNSTPQLVSPTAGGRSARCDVFQANLPTIIPLQGVAQPDDLFAGYGDSLNAFWNVGACLFECNPQWFQQVYHNAISFSAPSTVIYDASLFAEWAQTWGSDVPALIFLAHEWGHQYQYANGLSFQATFYAENDADTRAGYYMGAVAQQSGQTSFTKIAEMLQQFGCSIGDSGNVPWFDPNAHGSCQQRADAMINGFNQAISTSNVGRAGRSNPQAPAPETGTWLGTLTVSMTVVSDEGIEAQEAVPFDYSVSIDENGRVIDDGGTGPLPDVGESKGTPVQGNSLDFVVDATVTDFSFDDQATRYDWELWVESGTAGGVPVTGEGFETDVFALLPDGTMNAYMFMSLTLTGNNGNAVKLIIETTGILHQ